MFVSSWNSKTLSIFSLVVIALGWMTGDVNAQWQSYQSYKLVPATVYDQKPVTKSRWVNETVKERQKVTSYKMITQTEKRERKQITYKPVRTTSEREERVVEMKPYTETKFRTRKTEETTYEEVTDYRDEEYTVQKPIIRTEMREERYTVKKPVTQKLVEVKSTTTYKPRVSTGTEYVPTTLTVPQLVATAGGAQRPRMKWLESGYYTDPASGQTVYRRRGLHWVQPTAVVPAAATVPALIPQQRATVDYVPETVEERTPVEVTRMIEQVETRKVPVDVKEMVERTETRRVPYTRRIPKTIVTTDEIPYTQTRYKEVVTVRKVPYVETTYEKVETFEPYEVEVSKWVPVVREVEVPRVKTKRVDYDVMQIVPRTVMMKVPIDSCGREIGAPVLLDQPPVIETPVLKPVISDSESNVSEGFGTTVRRTPILESVLEPNPRRSYKGQLELVPSIDDDRTKTLDETIKRVDSVEVPRSAIGGDMGRIKRRFGTKRSSQGYEPPVVKEETPDEVEVKTIDETSDVADDVFPPQVEMPENEPTETGNENAEMRPPASDSDLPIAPASDEDVENETSDPTENKSSNPSLNGPA
ncbi:MAG: hypothetical protein AB8B55_20650 [Mariniblastus sp.]